MKGHFGCLETVFQAFHEYVLGIFKKLCAFRALDIAPILDIPSCFFFFRQTTEFIVYVPLFTETTKTTQAKSGQCNLSAKGPSFIFYFFLT